MRLGLFGGSFDPVHNGHVDLVNYFIYKLSLDKVFVIPTFVSPFKLDRPPLATPLQRVDMLRLAFEGIEKVKILTYELDQKTVSYTIDTVREVKQKFSFDDLFLLLSTELIPSFPLWKNFEEIKKLASVEFAPVRVCVSSTEIREKIKKRMLLIPEISPKVLDYIENHGLYSL